MVSENDGQGPEILNGNEGCVDITGSAVILFIILPSVSVSLRRFVSTRLQAGPNSGYWPFCLLVEISYYAPAQSIPPQGHFIFIPFGCFF